MNKLIDDIKLFCADHPWADRRKLEEALCGTQTLDLSLLGLEGEFSVKNEMLVDFILNGKYEVISVYVAHILRKVGVRHLASIYYQPAQDYIAELCVKGSHKLLSAPSSNELPRREYCETIVEALRAIDHHLDEGREMGLHTEVIYLHDEIFGRFMDRFDAGVLKAAHALFAVMDDNVAFRAKDYNEYLSYDDQSPAYYASLEDSMNYFYSEVDYIRDTYFAEGWLQEGSLSMLYLIAHADRRLIGKWFDE